MQAQACRLMAFTGSKFSVGSSAASLGGNLNAGVVERHDQSAERGDRVVDHRGDLGLVGHVAGHAEGVVTGADQLLGRDARRIVVDVGEHHGGARLGEGLRGRQTHPGARARHQGDLSGEVVGRVHVRLLRYRPRAWLRGEEGA
jgi:hypothetical protein